MKTLKPTPNKHHWPRNAVKSIECRKRDLIIRIADWGRDREEPAYDVECYIGGVYDWNESKSFTFHREHGQFKSKALAKRAAIDFANLQTSKLL